MCWQMLAAASAVSAEGMASASRVAREIRVRRLMRECVVLGALVLVIGG
jgi:hypothetical protein